jgi:hypothetical protein
MEAIHCGEEERATNRVARKSVQTEENENEKECSVVIAKDKRPYGSGDLCAPLFWPPSQLVALLGISAHMDPGNLELPVAVEPAQLVTYPPTVFNCTVRT